MNSRRLQKLGVPEDCVKSAIAAIQRAVSADRAKRQSTKPIITSILEVPEDHVADEHFGPFARDLIADREFVRAEPIEYRT